MSYFILLCVFIVSMNLTSCRFVNQNLALEHKIHNTMIESLEMEDVPVGLLMETIQKQNPSLNIEDIKIIYLPCSLGENKLTICFDNIQLDRVIKNCCILINADFRIDGDQIIVFPRQLQEKKIDSNTCQITLTDSLKWEILGKVFDEANNEFFQYLKKHKNNKDIILRSEVKLVPLKTKEILELFRKNDIALLEFWAPSSMAPSGEVNLLDTILE